MINEFSGVLSYKSSLPMKKEKDYSSNIFSPTFMVRYSPGKMRNLSGDDINLKYANLYKQEWIFGVFEHPGQLQLQPVVMLQLLRCFQPF